MMVYLVIEKSKMMPNYREVILGIYDSEERAQAELDSYVETCKQHDYYDDYEFYIDSYILNMPI